MVIVRFVEEANLDEGIFYLREVGNSLFPEPDQLVGEQH